MIRPTKLLRAGRLGNKPVPVDSKETFHRFGWGCTICPGPLGPSNRDYIIDLDGVPASEAESAALKEARRRHDRLAVTGALVPHDPRHINVWRLVRTN